MRTILPAAFILLLGAGCTAQGPETAGGEDGLARELAGLSPGEPRSCISATSNRTLVPQNETTVTLQEGRTMWVNRLRGPCPRLEPTVTLIVESQGGQYCSGDHIRALEFGSGIPGRTCFLGEWTPYRPR